MGNYSVSVKHNGALCTDYSQSQPCGALTCRVGGYFDTNTWEITLGAPTDWTFSRVDAWWDKDGGGIGSKTFTNADSVTVTFSGADGNVNFTPYLQYKCQQTKTNLYARKDRSSDWQLIDSNDKVVKDDDGSPFFFSVSVLDKNGSAALNPADTDNRIDIERYDGSYTTIFQSQDANTSLRYAYNLAPGDYNIRAKYKQRTPSDYWCASNSLFMTLRVPAATPTPTATPVPPTATPPPPTSTPTPAAWIKTKDASVEVGGIDFRIPSQVLPFDAADDTNEPHLIVGEEGAAQTPSRFPTGFGVSQKEWKAENYTRAPLKTKGEFLEYVRARKKYQDLDPGTFNISSITTPGIYHLPSSVTLSSDPGADMVLVVDGDVSIARNFNYDAATDQAKKAVAILADNIAVSSSVDHAYGIFITSGTFNPGTIQRGLKIKGNVIAGELPRDKRTQSDNRKPSVFIVLDAGAYMKLLPYLSVRDYEWVQLK